MLFIVRNFCLAGCPTILRIEDSTHQKVPTSTSVVEVSCAPFRQFREVVKPSGSAKRGEEKRESARITSWQKRVLIYLNSTHRTLHKKTQPQEVSECTVYGQRVKSFLFRGFLHQVWFLPPPVLCCHLQDNPAHYRVRHLCTNYVLYFLTWLKAT